MFVVDLELLGLTFSNHPVFESDRTFLLIGRDILNRYTLLLTGPRLDFEIT